MNEDFSDFLLRICWEIDKSVMEEKEIYRSSSNFRTLSYPLQPLDLESPKSKRKKKPIVVTNDPVIAFSAYL